MALGVTTGNPQLDSVTFVALSLVSGNVTITLSPSGSGEITMNQVGTDRGSAGPDGLTYFGYAGSATITGLSAFTRYTYTATQGTETVTGSFYTAPNDTDNFAVSFTTCFARTATDNMAWDFLEWYRQNGDLPLIANVHVDDVCYASQSMANDEADGKKVELGRRPAPWATAGKQYDYYFGYAQWFGTIGAITLAAGGTQEGALSTNFQSFRKNCNFLVQWGDWDFQNNLGWSNSLSTVPNAYHTTLAGYDGPGLQVWNTIMKPLQGVSLASADTNANHWATTLGCVQILCPDPITNAVPSTTVFGTNQIEDVLSGVNTQPFKLWAMADFAARPDGYYSSATYKTNTFVQAEYDRLFLDGSSSPSSIMLNSQTNGDIGCSVVLRGDTHYGMVWKFNGPAAGSNLAEKFIQVDLCTVNASAGGGGYDYAGIGQPLESEYTTIVGGLCGALNKNIACVVVEVYGSRAPKEIIIRRYQYAGNLDATTQEFEIGRTGPNNNWSINYERKIAQFQGNYGFGVNDVTWQYPRVSGAVD